MRIVAFSDTHGYHDQIKIPDGDILIFAGDMCTKRSLESIEKFNHFLGSLPHTHKIVIAGNHDFPFEREPVEARKLITNAIYLQDQSTVIEGIHFYGSPWQPWFFDWAFNLKRGQALKEKWDLISSDTDILITHSPPFGVLDLVGHKHVGCEELTAALMRIKPKYHIFGHIHEGYGTKEMNGTTFINAAICNGRFAPENKPMIIDYKPSHITRPDAAASI
ncbi:MAG: metallophosphatase domain-containing protein [Calditrichaceae bacterium]